MHMADALVSPVVGGGMWAASALLIGYSAKKVREIGEDDKIPLMGVMAAFIFAAQMINFTIPGTGSSGHLGGGMVLAIILGPFAGFLAMASVLVIQALFFADGGILALGCNIFNLGFFSCFIAYPLVYTKIAGQTPAKGRIMWGAILSGVLALQLGSFAVVIQTYLSGLTSLSLRTFTLFMQPIHLAIGIVEGVVTALVVTFIWNARPETLTGRKSESSSKSLSIQRIVLIFILFTIFIGGGLSWFASSLPDGLEWSLGKTTAQEEGKSPSSGLHGILEQLQQKFAFLPDYGFKSSSSGDNQVEKETWPAVEAGTAVSGIAGSLIILFLLLGLGFVIKRKKTDQRP
jgi:cobalt/nickel transport system permease protein